MFPCESLTKVGMRIDFLESPFDPLGMSKKSPVLIKRFTNFVLFLSTQYVVPDGSQKYSGIVDRHMMQSSSDQYAKVVVYNGA